MKSWRKIPGYPYYRINKRGQVLSIARTKSYIIRGKLVSRTYKAKLMKHEPHRGYPYVTLVKRGTKKTIAVHVLVARTFLGKKPKGLEVRHLDGDKKNCHPSNLSYGTKKQNRADDQSRKMGYRKLTVEEVKYARKHYEPGHRKYGSHALAKKFGVHQTTISYVVNGKSWSWVRDGNEIVC